MADRYDGNFRPIHGHARTFLQILFASLRQCRPRGSRTGHAGRQHASQHAVWHNVLHALDVNGDGLVVAGDALAIINYINAFGPRAVPANAAVGPPYLDTFGGPTAVVTIMFRPPTL